MAILIADYQSVPSQGMTVCHTSSSSRPNFVLRETYQIRQDGGKRLSYTAAYTFSL